MVPRIAHDQHRTKLNRKGGAHHQCFSSVLDNKRGGRKTMQGRAQMRAKLSTSKTQKTHGTPARTRCGHAAAARLAAGPGPLGTPWNFPGHLCRRRLLHLAAPQHGAELRLQTRLHG